MLDDKEYYLRATREFEENNLDEELWSKVIALADGAGSYDKPEIGAEIQTKYIAEYLCENFEKIIKASK